MFNPVKYYFYVFTKYVNLGTGKVPQVFVRVWGGVLTSVPQWESIYPQ